MARINPVQAQVVEIDAGAGKCVIVCKWPRGTVTFEVAEGHPLVGILTPNSLLTLALDVQTAHNEPALEAATRDLMAQPPQDPPLAAVPMEGFENKPIGSVKAALGLPDYSGTPAPKTGILTRE